MFTYGMPLPRIRLEIPTKSMEVFKQMKNYNKSSEFQHYARGVLTMVGARAVKNAGDYIQSGKAPRPSPITLKLREVVGDESKKALHQTGEMLRSIYSEVKGITLEFGVRGPRAGVARIQENGFVVRVTTKMLKGFKAIGRQYRSAEIIKWIRSKEIAGSSVGLGEDTGGSSVIKIPARPFLAPSLDKAVQQVMRSEQLRGLDAALVDVVASKIFGGRVEFGALTKYGTAYKVQPR